MIICGDAHQAVSNASPSARLARYGVRMSDVDRLLDAFATGALLRPSPEAPNIVDLARASALLAGAEGIQDTPGSATIAELIGHSDHIVLVLADGLGMNLLRRLPENAFLPSHLAAQIRTVFPSTTAAALTSLATGEWPSAHAVTGWWTLLPEIGSVAAILQFVTRYDRRPLTDLGVTAEQAFPLPSVMRSMRRDTLALFPDQIAHSVYSTYASGERRRCGYRNLRQAVDIIVERVRAADRSTYTYLYTPLIDHVAHVHGIERPEVRAAITETNREMERLHAELGGRGRIVLSADHGFLDSPVGTRHQISPRNPLMTSLRFPPSGDARVLYFHLRQGFEGRFRQKFQQQLGERFLLVTIEEAEHVELFGPGRLSPTTRARVGDLIAISTGPDVIEYGPAGGVGRVMSQASQHSGLSPPEMQVPLVVA